jgi:hypothetical protein
MVAVKQPIPTERVVQRHIIAMIKRCFPGIIVHHSPNGAHLAGGDGARFKQIGALKGDGMLVGWPDLAIYWNHGHCLMEVKRPGYSPSQVSAAQHQIHGLLWDMGFALAIVTSAEEAFAFLKECGAPSSVQGWRVAA